MDQANYDQLQSVPQPYVEPVIVREINILLMGETGVGKSTFINAFANYLTYASLSDAVKDDVISLIPAKFTVTDENFEERTIQLGSSENEVQEVGVSTTQNAKSYLFTLGDTRIRLIDTPGIGDTRGVDRDNANFEKLLAYLGEFSELNAICILLKPNNATITVMFEYCIKQLLSRLDKSASSNIVFLFTNSRSTFYRPSDTLPPLKKILSGTENRPPYVKIPLGRSNVYCIDNEAFRFLVALIHGVQFSDREKQDFESSWKISSEECWRFITYVAELKPHKVQNTISINEARRLIVQLSQPLAEITNWIQINIERCKPLKQRIQACLDDILQFKENLYGLVTNVRVEELNHPRTVYTNLKCCEVYKVNGSNTYHYKQVCHNPCGLKGVLKEIVGSPELLHCAAMDGKGHCQLYNIIDENVDTLNTTIENVKREAEKVSVEIEQCQNELKHKQDMIKSTAELAHFLQNNAITTYNDAYQNYLEYLIHREKSLGPATNKKIIENLQKMLEQYKAEKGTLDRALELAKKSNISATSTITANDVMATVNTLYGLKHFGLKIKEYFDKQNRAKKNENYVEREVKFTNRNMNITQRIEQLPKAPL